MSREFQTLRGAMVCLALSAVVSACGGKIPPAEEPLRPKEEKAEKVSTTDEKSDCEKVLVGDEKQALKYSQRSVPEAQALANEGFDSLRSAEERGVTRSERERMITEAVEKFMTALAADPYNVHATYNLAAAYARIDRPQCSVNLLNRLVSLRRLSSQTAKVEDKLDRLFGRGRYKNNLDPDFEDMRDDRRFREVAKKLQKTSGP